MFQFATVQSCVLYKWLRGEDWLQHFQEAALQTVWNYHLLYLYDIWLFSLTKHLQHSEIWRIDSKHIQTECGNFDKLESLSVGDISAVPWWKAPGRSMPWRRSRKAPGFRERISSSCTTFTCICCGLYKEINVVNHMWIVYKDVKQFLSLELWRHGIIIEVSVFAFKFCWVGRN